MSRATKTNRSAKGEGGDYPAWRAVEQAPSCGPRLGGGMAVGSALMLQGAAGLISGVCACGVAGGRCYHPRLMQMTGAEVSPEYSWILDRSDAECRDFRVFSVSGAF